MISQLSVKDMIIQALRGDSSSSCNDDEEYGVYLDEMDELKKIPDLFDCTPFNGCDPPILHFAPEPIVYCTVPIGDEGRTLDIMQLAYNMILPGYTVIFTGRRRSGKTKLIRALCRHLRKWYPEVVVFTRTKASGEYARFIPHARIIQGFDPELLIELGRIQRAKKRAQSRGKLEDVNFNLLVILDDCLAERLQWSQELNAIFFEGRHLDITLFVSIQDVKGCAPAATGNADFSFLFPFGDERTFESVRDKYMSFLDKYELKDLIQNTELRKKFHVLGVDVAHKSNCDDRKVSFGCVDEDDEHEDFVMGSPAMWKESYKQLRELNCEHLISLEDWGILKPSQYCEYVKQGCPLQPLKRVTKKK